MAPLITKRYINCNMCEPEYLNEATSMGDNIYEISSDKCAECVSYHDTPTCQKVCPTPNTILKDSAHVETEKQLWDKSVPMHHADRFQPRRHLAMKLSPYPCNKRIIRRLDKALRVAIR